MGDKAARRRVEEKEGNRSMRKVQMLRAGIEDRA
jgi:hypothetical protein